jgi:deazaflavin-dependent oxidoreductase (nitroreductase family)
VLSKRITAPNQEPTVNDTLDPTTSTEPTGVPAPAVRYIQPKKATNTFNRVVARLTRMGISVWGSRELRVRGRKTGEWRTTPVNLLTHEGQTYLVAPRGTTQWVRNLRAADGHGELRLGRHTDGFTAVELADADKVDVLRAYLKRWKMEVGVFFDGVDAKASDEELLAIAPGYPVFAITIAA